MASTHSSSAVTAGHQDRMLPMPWSAHSACCPLQQPASFMLNSSGLPQTCMLKVAACAGAAAAVTQEQPVTHSRACLSLQMFSISSQTLSGTAGLGGGAACPADSTDPVICKALPSGGTLHQPSCLQIFWGGVRHLQRAETLCRHCSASRQGAALTQCCLQVRGGPACPPPGEEHPPAPRAGHDSHTHPPHAGAGCAWRHGHLRD